jgi:hypothetical protein
MARSSEDLPNAVLALNPRRPVGGESRGESSVAGMAPDSSRGTHLDPAQGSQTRLKTAQGEKPALGFIHDQSAVATLRQFFELLDEWDRHDGHGHTHSS